MSSNTQKRKAATPQEPSVIEVYERNPPVSLIDSITAEVLKKKSATITRVIKSKETLRAKRKQKSLEGATP